MFSVISAPAVPHPLVSNILSLTHGRHRVTYGLGANTGHLVLLMAVRPVIGVGGK